MLKTFSSLRYLGIFTLLIAIFISAGCSNSSDDSAEVKLKNVEISNNLSSIPVDSQLVLAATAFFDNGDKSDYSSKVDWSSSDPSIATISADGTITTIKSGTVTITAKYEGISVSVTIEVNSATLEAISISPQNKNILVSQTSAMNATGIYSNGSKQDITSQVSWSLSNNTVATITKNVITGKAAGTATITATLGDISTNTKVNVAEPTLASIQINVPDQKLIEGTSVKISANGLYNDNKYYDITNLETWTSSDTSVARFTENTLSLLKAGTVDISYTIGAITNKRTLTVVNASLESIVIEPATVNIHAGETAQFRAQGFYNNGSSSDITSQVQWSVDKTALATINNVAQQEGKFTALTSGNVDVTASLKNISGSSEITISAALLQKITINYDTNTIAPGTTLALSATGIYSDDTFHDITQDVIWQSSNSAIASIETAGAESGTLHGISPGSTTISATLGSGNDKITATLSFKVTSAVLTGITIENLNSTLYPGSIHTAQAVGTFSDNSSQIITNEVTWNSENSNIADVSNSNGNSGQITAYTAGETKIVATLNNISGTVTVTVAPITLSEIIVDADSIEIANGTKTYLHATGVYSDNSSRDISDTVEWKSSNPAGLNISNLAPDSGLLSGLLAGSYTVTAKLDDISTTVNVSVTAATLSSLEISPATITLVNSTSTSLIATGVFSNGTRQDLSQQVLWQSSDSNIASINKGKNNVTYAKGIAKGNTSITASLSGITKTVNITVNENTLESITLIDEAGGAVIAAGFSKKLSAMGTFLDNSTQSITDQVSWRSVDSSICSFTDSVKQPGVIYGLRKGNCQIIANIGNTSGTFFFDITDATLTSIAVTPQDKTIAKGSQTTLVATGTYSDASTSNISTQVTWKTLDVAVSVSNLANNKGIVTALSEGSGTVKAELNGKSASANITVTSAVLESIAISTDFPTIYKGSSVAFKAEGTYTDDSKQDITNQVIWSSADENIAQISNAESSRGLLYALLEGNTTISASLNDLSKDIDVTVTNDPTAPTSLSLTTTPRVILNDGIETIKIDINVNAALKTATVPDGTVVDVKIIFGAGTLSAETVTTTSGHASVTFSSTVKGISVIKASIPDTLINNSATIYSTDNFNETISNSKFIRASLDNDGKVKAGSDFGFAITNLSDHTFNLTEFTVSNADGILYEASKDTTQNLLKDNLLSGGETVALIYRTDEAVHNSIVIEYKLTDPATSEELLITANFTLTTVAKPSN